MIKAENIIYKAIDKFLKNLIRKTRKKILIRLRKSHQKCWDIIKKEGIY